MQEEGEGPGREKGQESGKEVRQKAFGLRRSVDGQQAETNLSEGGLARKEEGEGGVGGRGRGEEAVGQGGGKEGLDGCQTK